MRGERFLLLPGLLFLLLFFGYPLFSILERSLAAPEGLTLARYAKALTAPAYLEAWRNSVVFATLSTLVAALGGLFLAYWTSKLSLRWKGFLMSLYAIPVSLSGLVVAFGFIVLLGRNGVLNQIFASLGWPRFDLYSWVGLFSVFPFYNIPLFALALMPLLESVGRSLMEAARASGATPFQAWVRVLLPALMPGILAGSSIVFAGMMGAFGTALALTGFAKNLLSLQIYSLVAESTFDLPLAAALSVVLMASTGVGLYLLALWERRYRR
ncbi:Spermidine/putrescine transport system permease protein PotB (plasmid) [Thermus thermophilus]|uniref:Spermidine/putrescine transport system permease protein PotB n=1 Tax=Thermus thermophilus TaxID=274 RepID=A0A3P4AU28_THETH|nr:ABC transporter permease subunit [Thermus thermophilus]VCU54642.1 Spermidine/putrescine transport system permease protein PotB [Thermus thermophilus]